jgi:hypothetical protein
MDRLYFLSNLKWNYSVGWAFVAFEARAWRFLKKSVRENGELRYRDCRTASGASIDEAVTNLLNILNKDFQIAPEQNQS